MVALTLYQDWSDDLRKAENASLQGVLPQCWLSIVGRLTRTNTASNIKMAISGSDEKLSYHGDLSEADKLAVRLFRYLSSEQLLSLLISGQRYMPLAAFNQMVRGDKLNRAYASIAQNSIPAGYAVIYGISLTFDQWINLKVTGEQSSPICPSLARYLVNEAAFLTDRHFVNAIKHGRARFFGDSVKLAVEAQLDNEWVSLLEQSEVIFVEDWKQERLDDSLTFSHCMSCETFDLKEDIGVIYINSLLVSAILSWRQATLKLQLSGMENVRVNFNVPNNIVVNNRVSRLRGLPVGGPSKLRAEGVKYV